MKRRNSETKDIFKKRHHFHAVTDSDYRKEIIFMRKNLRSQSPRILSSIQVHGYLTL